MLSRTDFVDAVNVTPTLKTDLGCRRPDYDLDGSHRRLVPKTKGRRLEETDVIFGVVQGDKRRADIAQRQHSLQSAAHLARFLVVLRHDVLWGGGPEG